MRSPGRRRSRNMPTSLIGCDNPRFILCAGDGSRPSPMGPPPGARKGTKGIRFLEQQ